MLRRAVGTCGPLARRSQAGIWQAGIWQDSSLPSIPAALDSLRHFGSSSAAAATAAEQGEARAALGLEAVEHAVSLHVAPRRGSLRGMLQQCDSSQDLDRALGLLARVRLENAAYRKHYDNFGESLSVEVVRACLRVGAPDKALLALSPTNPFGLSPALPATHHLLRHAREQQAASLALSALNRALRSGLRVSNLTADLTVSALVAAGDVSKACSQAAQFSAQGLALKGSTLDALLEALLAHGMRAEYAKLIVALEQSQTASPKSRRQGRSLKTSILMSLGHLLCGNVEQAVGRLISAQQQPKGNSAGGAGAVSGLLCELLPRFVSAWESSLSPGCASGREGEGDVEGEAEGEGGAEERAGAKGESQVEQPGDKGAARRSGEEEEEAGLVQLQARVSEYTSQLAAAGIRVTPITFSD